MQTRVNNLIQNDKGTKRMKGCERRIPLRLKSITLCELPLRNFNQYTFYEKILGLWKYIFQYTNKLKLQHAVNITIGEMSISYFCDNSIFNRCFLTNLSFLHAFQSRPTRFQQKQKISRLNVTIYSVSNILNPN